MAQNLVVMFSSISALFADAFKAYGTSAEEQWDVFIIPNNHKSLMNPIEYFLFRKNICGYKNKFYDKLRQEFIGEARRYKKIVFLNLQCDDHYFIDAKVAEVLSNKDCRLYFLDPLNEMDHAFPYWNLFKTIYSFEYCDTVDFGPKHGLKIEFLPLGTRYYLYDNDMCPCKQKKFNLCFVGMGTPERLPYLEKVAMYAYEHGLKFYVAGYFWHTNNFVNSLVSKFKFAKKYPFLSKYVHNKFVDPKELHDLYYQTKICLNINTSGHDTFNSRCIDILYCGGVVLTDQENTHGYNLEAEKHFYSCPNPEEMVSKLKFLLAHYQDIQDGIIEGKNVVREQYVFTKTIAAL